MPRVQTLGIFLGVGLRLEPRRGNGSRASGGRVFRSRPLFDGPTLPTKSLAQIGDEVFRMFEANRKAE